MGTPSKQRLSTSTMVVAGVLLAIPLAALLAVPLYARRGPELWGFPFFYWYQLLLVLICTLFTSSAHWLIRRDRRGGGR
jgi:Na+/melibiose symporter-like transporter